MKTISKKTILAGLLAVAALAPMEAGAMKRMKSMQKIFAISAAALPKFNFNFSWLWSKPLGEMVVQVKPLEKVETIQVKPLEKVEAIQVKPLEKETIQFKSLEKLEDEMHHQLWLEMGKNCSVKMVKEIIEGYKKYVADVNELNEFRRSAFSLAIFYNRLDVVKYLVKECFVKECGVLDVNKVDTSGGTVLFQAVCYGPIDIVKYLIEKCGADANILDIHGRTVLQRAAVVAERKNVENIKYIIEKCGVDVNKVDKYGRTLLGDAVQLRSSELTKYLIEECGAIAYLNPVSMDPSKEVANYLIWLGLSSIGLSSNKDNIAYDNLRKNRDKIAYANLRKRKGTIGNVGDKLPNGKIATEYGCKLKPIVKE